MALSDDASWLWSAADFPPRGAIKDKTTNRTINANNLGFIFPPQYHAFFILLRISTQKATSLHLIGFLLIRQIGLGMPCHDQH
jgi:hypothetical protein